MIKIKTNRSHLNAINPYVYGIKDGFCTDSRYVAFEPNKKKIMKLKRLFIKLITVILLILINTTVYPCTTFVLQQEKKIVFGRNLDWMTGYGLIITNPRNIKKTALVDPSEKPIQWISKYGNMTFNQLGRDLPYGGMNEAGLVVEHMTLEETEYPTKDNRYAINAFQWIQFQLDNFSKVEEVLNSDTLLRIVDATSKIHFLICDRYGNVATIEYLHGKTVIHYQDSLPITVLANNTYDRSLTCYKLEENTDFDRSLYNFCTAANTIQNFQESSNDSLVENAFRILNSINLEYWTKWSIVYDISDMKIYFKIFETPTIRGDEKIFTKPAGQADLKSVDFKNFSFNCRENIKVFNLNGIQSGEVDNLFLNYSTEINKKYIAQSFKFFKDWGFLMNIDSEIIDYLAKYPESFICFDD